MERHRLLTSLRYHLLPGLLVVLLYVLFVPVFHDHGYPSIAALGVAALIGIVPLQMGHLLYQGYLLNGKISLRGVISPSEKIPVWKFVLVVVGSLAVLVLIGGLAIGIEPKIKSELFGWIPSWYFYDENFMGYPREILVVTACLRLVIDGLVLPVTEELYFRGYLLPRLPVEAKYKLPLGAALFALYHFWQPWNLVSLFLISLVLIWPVVRFKNLYLSIAIHMCANLIGTLLFFGQITQVH